MGLIDDLTNTASDILQPLITNAPQSIAGEDRYESVDVINLKNITQVYKDNGNVVKIFDNFSYDIKDIVGRGQFVTILGKSGCGKSTLLRYIAGLQTPTAGEVYIYGKLKTNKDRIPMVFQQYSSFPWKTVLDNVALPLFLKGVNLQEAYEKAREIIKIVELDGHEDKWAQYPLLSGGQLQRVAIARNLIASPQILLMDEPFGALDIVTRNKMQETIIKIFSSATLDPTVIFVTHDISEAVFLSDTILILDANPGRVAKQIKIKKPYPRTAEFKRTPEFNNYVTEIEDTMNFLNSKK